MYGSTRLCIRSRVRSLSDRQCSCLYGAHAWTRNMVSVVRKGPRMSGHAQCPTKGRTDRDRWREGEKAVDESQKGTTELWKSQASAVSTLGFVAGSPVCPLSVRPLSTSPGGPQLLLTTIDHHHFTLAPSNPGATLIHPRRAGTPPSDPCSRPGPALDAQLHPKSQVCTRTCLDSHQVPSARHGPFFRCGTPSHHSGDSLSASLQACKQCAPNCGAGAVAEETCRCWQEEGSSIAAAFRPLRAKDGRISPLASRS
ncbi:hypothetical protein J3F84DRAFT_191818 [Trichoderma pleuroticola]